MKCQCGNKSTGSTSVTCCNLCGLPLPGEPWDIPGPEVDGRELVSEIRDWDCGNFVNTGNFKIPEKLRKKIKKFLGELEDN